MPNLEEYVIKPVEGVFQVYRNSADAEAGKIAEGYDYPDLDTYVSDMHLMCALIGNLHINKQLTIAWRHDNLDKAIMILSVFIFS